LIPPLQLPLPPATSLPNCTSPAPHSTGQPFQPGPDPCKHLLYFDLVIPNAKTVGLDHVGSYCHSLVCTLDKLFKVDSSISLFPYGLPSPRKLRSLNLAPLWGTLSPNLGSTLMVSGSPEMLSLPFLFLPSWVLTQMRSSLPPTAKPSLMELVLISISTLSNLPRSPLLDGFLGPIAILTQPTWRKLFKRPWILHTLAMASGWVSDCGVVPKRLHCLPPQKPPLTPTAFQALGDSYRL